MASVRLLLMVALRSTTPGRGRPVKEHKNNQIILGKAQDWVSEASVTQAAALKPLSHGYRSRQCL